MQNGICFGQVSGCYHVVTFDTHPKLACVDSQVKGNHMKNRIAKLSAIAATVAAIPMLASAGTDVTDIVTGAQTTFVAVATLCVSIGIFFVGYRLAKRVK